MTSLCVESSDDQVCGVRAVRLSTHIDFHSIIISALSSAKVSLSKIQNLDVLLLTLPFSADVIFLTFFGPPFNLENKKHYVQQKCYRGL